jgi:hypothetical protein
MEMKGKTCALVLLLLGALLYADESTDYYAFGENRANLPGPEILSSVYAENPAAIADAIRNSISYRLIGLFAPQGSNLGMAYSLSIPSFTVFGITETAVGTAVDLLGVQFGLSSRSFLPDLPGQMAAGVSILRAARFTAAGTESGFRLDLGISASFASLRIEALVKNALVLASSGLSAFGPSAEYGVTVGGKLILDIDCVLGASYSPALAASSAEGVEMAGSLRFIRYFFDNSLRAGIELTAYADFDKPANLLPVVEYGMAVSYIMPDFFPVKRTETGYFLNILSSALTFLSNLSLDGSVLVIVNNFPGRQGMRVIAGIGMTKFY